LDPDWNPGGVWRPVHIEETGPVRIQRLRALCTEASAERAAVALRAVLDAAAAGAATVRTTIAGAEHSQEVRLAAGENRLQWNVVIDRPALWWPHALGDQPMHDLTVEVAQDGDPSDARTVHTG